MRSTALLLAVSACLSMSIMARADAPAGAGRFQVVFQRGASALPGEGPQAAANAAAIGRIANTFGRVGSLKSIRFTFVAARPVCDGAGSCDANRLAWSRVQALTLAIDTLLQKPPATSLYRRPAGLVFPDELDAPVNLAETPPGWEGLTLFLDRGETVPPGACHAKVLLRDPDLPARIGGEGPVIGLAGGEHAEAGPDARLAVVPEQGQTVHAVWSDENGGFRKGDPADGAFHPLPRGAAKLYLLSVQDLSVQGEDAELHQFLSGLSDVFTAGPAPSFLSADTAFLEPDDKGFGPKPFRAPPRQGRPSRTRRGAAPTVCEYLVSAASLPGEPAAAGRAAAHPSR
jgi:hypothetical protein